MNSVNQSSSGWPVEQSLDMKSLSLWALTGCSGAWPLPVGSQMSFISLEAWCSDNILLFGLCKTDSWTKPLAVWRTGQTNSATMPIQCHGCEPPLCLAQPARQGLWSTWLLLLFCVHLLLDLNSECTFEKGFYLFDALRYWLALLVGKIFKNGFICIEAIRPRITGWLQCRSFKMDEKVLSLQKIDGRAEVFTRRKELQ